LTASQFRLVTRSDFDGLVCGVLLKELDLIDEIAFVHPKDMQDGKIPISARDITTNLPYVPSCHLAFDHHSSELTRNGERHPANYVIDPEAQSAARVVYRHFGGAQRFPRVREDLLAAVDKADAAQFSREEIFDPQGWPLLSFLMDSRTGLGRFRQFRISNYDLMMQLIEECRSHGVEEILALAWVGIDESADGHRRVLTVLASPSSARPVRAPASQQNSRCPHQANRRQRTQPPGQITASPQHETTPERAARRSGAAARRTRRTGTPPRASRERPRRPRG